MGLRNRQLFEASLPAGFDGLWDFDVLEGCFPKGVSPMDFDGVLEHNGQFLIFETKMPGAEMPRGQQRCFEALLKKGGFTIFFVGGKPGHTDLAFLEIWYREDWHIKKRRIAPLTNEKLRRFCRMWWRMAEKAAKCPPKRSITGLKVVACGRLS